MSTPSNTVYISNLSYKRDRNGLKSLFARYGTIKNIKIIMEPTTQQSRGMAFIEMSSVAEAKKAIEGLNQAMIDGRTVKANFAIPLKPSSVSKIKEVQKKQKDLEFKDVQLMKKARNEARRKANPFR
ncbi:MAG: RNA-binding protein [Bacteriovoracaceae bacterium]|nr:RNA-binding protein [Bacteriovoracaceae bacterium]